MAKKSQIESIAIKNTAAAKTADAAANSTDGTRGAELLVAATKKPVRRTSGKKSTAAAADELPATKKKTNARKSSGAKAAKAIAPPNEVASTPDAGKTHAVVDTANLRIFQIYYQRDHFPLLDKNLEPYNNIGDSNPLLEFNVFCKLHKDETLRSADLWGALSWKFGQKTGLSGGELKKIIAANPGYDVYYCNPHPDSEALYHNLWLQGETCHPNFLVLCREFFQCADLPVELLTELQPSRLFSSANYLVGTPAFWDRYLPFIGNILAKVDKKLSPTAKTILYSSRADSRGMHAEASYIPFIVERLFAVFLQTTAGEIKALKIPLATQDEKLNIHLKMLRQMKDIAHAQRSLWLAACWANYRSLYISSAYSKDWVKKYLKAVTPTAIRFADLPVTATAA